MRGHPAPRQRAGRPLHSRFFTLRLNFDRTLDICRIGTWIIVAFEMKGSDNGRGIATLLSAMWHTDTG